MPDFVVERLCADRIALAYPLIREVAPALDLQRWMRFARRAAEPRQGQKQGILVVSRAGYRAFPCGLVCYRREEDLASGPLLTADYFITMDLLDSEAALDALVKELEATARRMDCRAIRSLVNGASPDVLSKLLSAGHRPRGSTLLKVL